MRAEEDFKLLLPEKGKVIVSEFISSEISLNQSAIVCANFAQQKESISTLVLFFKNSMEKIKFTWEEKTSRLIISRVNSEGVNEIMKKVIK